MNAVGACLGLLIGLSLGVLGGGGSILTVPIFVYVLGFGVKESIAMSLAVVGATSLFGAAGHWRIGNVNVRVAALFGGAGMLGTFGGAHLAVLVSGAFQLALFATVMLIAAVFMFRGSVVGPRVAADRPPASLLLTAANGFAVGVLTGLIGVGGGFLIVPALVLLGGVPIREAVGTSLLVIAMNSMVGFVGYLGHTDIRWAFIVLFAATTVPGILAGAYINRFVSQPALRRGFAVFLVLMGVYILYQNRAVLLAAGA